MDIKTESNLQPILLIGAMKCGTTTIHKHLSKHPQVAVPPNKEPGFFCDKMGDPKYKVNDYYSIFNLEPQHTHTLDASTHYTKFPAEENVPQNIAAYGLMPKFIYIVRNPFDRIESHFNYMSRKLEWKEKITSEHLINVSNYYQQLQHFAPYFEPQDFLLLDFDELKVNPKEVMKKVYDFVGLDQYVFEENKQQYNKTKAVNRNELKLRKSLGGKFNFLPQQLRVKLKQAISVFLVKKKKSLSKRNKKYIHQQLKSDMLKLRDEYGINVKKWGFE